MSILVIAEHRNDSLDIATLKTLGAAKQIAQETKSEIHVLVAGHNCKSAAEAAAKADGVTKVFHVDAPHLEYHLAEPMADVILGLADGYSHILAPASTFGKNVMPRVAALLDVQQVSDIIGVDGPDTFRRPVYAGNAIAAVKSAQDKQVITVRPTAFDAVAAEGGNATNELIDAPDDKGLSSYVSSELTQSDRPTLDSASIVVSGGRGFGSGEKFKMLESLAGKLNAAIGASRAAVDAGYVPNDYQVGQTGKIVAPDLYIAIGISGAIQHLAGMKESKVIVAINKDPDAPIFQIADYGLVADLFDAVPELEAAL